MKFFIRFRILFIFPILFGLLFSHAVSAALIRSGNDVRLIKKETIDENVYIVGGNTLIESPVLRDVIVGAGSAILISDVNEDVFVFGGTVEIQGNIGGDLRVFAGQVELRGNVNGDVLVGSGRVRAHPSSTVHGDVIAGSGQINIDGTVNGKTKIWGGRVQINGILNNEANIKTDDQLSIGPEAEINGKLIYRSPKKAIVSKEASINAELQHEPAKDAKNWFKSFGGYWSLVKLFSLVIAALFLALFGRKTVEPLVRDGIEKMGRNFLKGVGVFFVASMIILLSFITVIGSFLGLFGALLFGAALLWSKVMSGILFGGLLFKWMGRNSAFFAHWQSAIIGTALLIFIGHVPYIGWMISGIFFFAALGLTSERIFQAIKLSRQ